MKIQTPFNKTNVIILLGWKKNTLYIVSYWLWHKRCRPRKKKIRKKDPLGSQWCCFLITCLVHGNDVIKRIK